MTTDTTTTTTTAETCADALRSARHRMVKVIELLATIEPAEMTEADVLSIVNTAELYATGAITNIDVAEVTR